MRIVLYTRRNTGLIALSHLVALGHDVMVVTDDDNVKWLAERFGCILVHEQNAGSCDYDYIFSVHWHKKISMKLMPHNNGINFHPCLSLYKGKDPISRYIQDKQTRGSVSSHIMTSVFDEGEVIHEEYFETGVVSSYAEFYNQAFFHYWKCIDETLNKILK